MFRYRLERQFMNKWWSLSLWPDLYSAVQFMSVYDPDGTVRMRVWDIEADEAVPTELLFRTKKRCPKPQVDWINDGF